ncbi:MAG: hypothetical protein AAGA48_36615 [Myxococcota bacterium]
MSTSRLRALPFATSTVIGLLLAVACGPSEERWTTQAPSVSCKLLRRCDPISFYRDFADLDACEDATDLGDVSGCAYDPKAARECREALRWNCRKVGRRFDEVEARCNAVWTCDSGTDTGRSSLRP